MVCKGLWRIGAGVLLGQQPAGVDVMRDRWNRPVLTGIQRDALDLNVTRTRTHCGLVVARGCRVGIDLETVESGLITTELVRAVMHDQDAGLDHADADAFFQFWTMKEAVLKADGRGLEVDPRQVHAGAASVDDGDWALCGCHGDHWLAKELRCPPSIRGAIASNRVPLATVHVEWESIVASVMERGSCAGVASPNP